MLKDLLNEFIHHQDQYPEFDIDAMLIDNYRLKPGLYIKINRNGDFDELYVGKKGEISANDSLVEWFKRADFYSSLIEMNKPVDPKKKIHSNNKFSLFCKLETFWNEGLNPQLEEHIERYFNALMTVKDKESAEILTTAGYKPLDKKDVEEYKQLFLSSLNEVGERIRTHNIRDNCYIKLFIDEKIDAYSYECGRYMLPKIFNCNNYNESVNGKVLGLSNTDMGMNAKKPYLEHKTTQYKVPYRIETEEAIKLWKLYIWFNGQTRDEKPLYNGYIPIGEHDPQLLAVAKEIGVRKAVFYLHFERGIEITIDDFDMLPSFKDEMDRPIIFKNYLDVPNYKGGRKQKLSEVEEHINEYLFASQLSKNYDVEKVQVTNKLSQALAVQIMLSREAMKAWLRKGDTLPLRSCVDKITKGVVLARLQNLEYASALAHMLNVRLSLLNYFNEEGKDMGEIIKDAYESLKVKVLNTDKNREPVTCESNTEFCLAVGQLLYYYFSLSEAQKISYDVLWRIITAAKDAEGLKREQKKYFQKYAYRIDTNNPRFNNMLSIVTSYVPEKEEPADIDALLFGFVTSNIIYLKKEDA
ncbi:MAG: hypothetical protein ACOX2X_00805 [Peptococcia bacterium]|jgi:CRISPR-associated protein Csh1